MRLTRTILGFTAAACFTLTSAYADHGHSSAPKPTTVAGKPAANKSTADHTIKPHKPTTTKTTKSAGKSTKMKTTKSGSTTTPQLNPIAAKISSKRNLNTKISAMLPQGMTLNDASTGFKNQGQFIAALHASQRHDCGAASCFSLIKADMVDKHMSLGQSIQDVKHTTSTTAASAATTAEHQAEHDLGEGDEHHEVREHSDSHEESAHGNTLAEQISRNTQLSAKVQALLPAGMALKKAAKGFGSESQFLAALHASKDLGIPFAQIKGEMTGHDHDSLTQAIRELKPTVDALAGARIAQQEASADIRSTLRAHADHDDQ